MKSSDCCSWLVPSLEVRLSAGGALLVKVGILCLLLVWAPNCATQRIIGNEFVQKNKGYSFVLPGVDWEVDDEAWRYERDFGYNLVKRRSKSRVIRNRRSRSGSKRDNLQIQPRFEEKYEKLLLDMDTGFRHKARTSKILIGTIIEGSLIKFIKGNFLKTDSDLPENLIAGYMERLRDFYPTNITDPSAVTVRTLPQSGQAYRMEWIEGRERHILYGIYLNKEFLFISLQVNREAPASAIKERVKTLDQLVDSVVVQADK